MSHFPPRNLALPLTGSVATTPGPLRVEEMVRVMQPADPVHCLRPALLTATAERFVQSFPGTTLYAVKCNPEPAVLRALWDGGVRHFDCASAGEVALVRDLFPEAVIHFMHPVKSRRAIADAYLRQGVRDFVLDSREELAKILDETDGAADLGLVIRIALPKGGALYDLSGKFGAAFEEAVDLLRAARPLAVRLGVSFHVGSQCMEPLAYRRALILAGEVIRAAGVAIEIIDVGGGFPVSYPDLEPPPLGAYFAEIEAAFEELGLPSAALWAEPGRVLVAAGTSVVLQVQLRRGEALYVNDGVYGSLSDAGAPGFRFPVRLIRAAGGRAAGGRAGGSTAATLAPFAFWGPTCDSADYMKGPFWLPEDIREGDWIEVGQLGAYGACLATQFNGFDQAEMVEVTDGALLQTPGHPGDELPLALAA